MEKWLRTAFAVEILLLTDGLASRSRAQTCPSPAVAANTTCTVPPGTTITVAPAGAIGLNSSGAAGHIVANGIIVNLNAATTTGGLAQTGSIIDFNSSTLATTIAASSGQIGLRATDIGSTINVGGSIITIGTATSASNMIGATAAAGASLVLSNTPITMLGAAAGLNNIGLLATGAGSQISYSGGTISTQSRASFGVQAISGGRVMLDGGAQVTTTGAGSASIAGSHALFATGANSVITGTGIGLTVSGAVASGARAESGGFISLTGGTIMSSATGLVDTDPAAAARALTGSTLLLDGVTINASGQRGGGFAVHDAGSVATVLNSTISVTGLRTYGGLVRDGGQAIVTNTSLLVDNVTGGFAVLGVEGVNSTATLNNVTLHHLTQLGYGLRVGTGGAATMNGGSSTTEGRDAPALVVSNGSVVATNVALTTNGNDNAMGALADINGQLTLIGGSILTTGNAVRASSFPHALGARNPGAFVTATDTSIETRGSIAMGAVADDGGTVILSGNSIRTLGPGSIGLFSVTEQTGAQFPASITGSGLTIETFGAAAHGTTAQARNDISTELAQLTISNSTVTTHGNLAVGLRAVLGNYGTTPATGRGEAAVIANNTDVLTEGTNAHGALSRDNPTSVTLNNSRILSTGATAHGSVAEAGGRIIGNDSSIRATGAQGSALYVTGFPGAVSSGTFTGSALVNVTGPTIGVGGSGDVSLTNSFAGGSGQWLRVGTSTDFPPLTSDTPIHGIPDPDDPAAPPLGAPAPSPGAPVTPGLANVTLSNSQVIGSALTAAGSVSNVTLLNNSIWIMTGNSNLTNLTNDPSLIDFTPPTGDPTLLASYKTLTVVNYVGIDGIIGLNTYLGTDGSPSDRLIIDGGTATGTSPLRITNTTGPGARTIGNGILVVDAIAGATTVPGAFTLARPVVAGPYDYGLFRGSVDASNAEAWYLRTLGGFRPETSLYPVIPALALVYGHTLLDTLHERVGEDEDALSGKRNGGDSKPKGSWARVIGQFGHQNGSLGTSPTYDYRLFALQVGQDLLRRENAEGARDRAGIYGAIGDLNADVNHVNGILAGTNRWTAYTLGAYWTHYAPSDWYLDAILQGTWYRASGKPARDVPGLNTRGFGFAASLEAGYPFKLDKGWLIEPQAQLVYERVRLDDGHEGTTTVSFGNADSLLGRLGVRVAKKWAAEDKPNPRMNEAWLRANYLYEFRGDPITEFSSADGNIPFRAYLGGASFNINAGATAQIKEQTWLYANVSYQARFDGGGYSYNGKVGIKTFW